jgi:hypothetical protein
LSIASEAAPPNHGRGARSASGRPRFSNYGKVGRSAPIAGKANSAIPAAAAARHRQIPSKTRAQDAWRRTRHYQVYVNKLKTDFIRSVKKQLRQSKRDILLSWSEYGLRALPRGRCVRHNG